MLASAFKSEFRPACACSTRTTRTTRTCDFPHNAPPLVRLEHPEQRTTAGPVDREHPVFVRLVRVKIACRFGHCLTFTTSAPQHHGAFWHFPPRRARSLKARANHATHPTPRARESIGYVSVVITTWLSLGTWRSSLLVFAELRWRRWLCAKKSRRGTAIDKKNGRRSTREGAARRGRVGVMRAVAAVRTFGLCGT